MKTVSKARLLVTRFPYESRFGGEEVHTLTLMDKLDKRGHSVHFLGSCSVLLERFKGDGVKKAWLGKPPVTKLWLVLFTALSPILFVLAGWQLWQARRKWRVDVLYALSLGEKLMMTPWALLFGMHVLWLQHARIGPWITKNPWRPCYTFLSRFVTVVVTSNAMVEKVTFAKKVEGISCGIILEKSVPLRREIKDFLKGGFGVGTVARLTVDKGVDMMVKLVDTEPVMRLVIVGNGPLESLIKKSPHKDRIFHVKSMPRGELTSLYKALDLFVLASSKFDPFGMVAAEAMTAGTATVVTQECGISYDLKDGVDAAIIPAKFSALDKTVKSLKKNAAKREKMAKAGMSFAKKNYSLDLMVDNFESLLEDIMS